HERVFLLLKDKRKALPAAATGSGRQRPPWLEDLGRLQIRSQVVARTFTTRPDENEEEREVDTTVHSFSLNAPCSAEHFIRHLVESFRPHGLDLREISTKIVDDIGTLEVRRKPT